MKNISFFLYGIKLVAISLATISPSNAQFSLKSNNVTIECPGVSIGSTGEVNGKNYIKVDRSTLQTMISNGDDVSCVCTTGITNMSGLFQNNQTFNQDISSWDVSSVNNMQGLFQNAQAFNQDIGYWDISSMRDQNGVNQLFDNASSLNQDLSYWCCLLYTSPSPRDLSTSRMPSSA